MSEQTEINLKRMLSVSTHPLRNHTIDNNLQSKLRYCCLQVLEHPSSHIGGRRASDKDSACVCELIGKHFQDEMTIKAVIITIIIIYHTYCPIVTFLHSQLLVGNLANVRKQRVWLRCRVSIHSHVLMNVVCSGVSFCVYACHSFYRDYVLIACVTQKIW